MACISRFREQKSTKIDSNLPQLTNRSQNKLSVAERLKKLVIFGPGKSGLKKRHRLTSIQESGEKVDFDKFQHRLEKRGVLAK